LLRHVSSEVLAVKKHAQRDELSEGLAKAPFRIGERDVIGIHEFFCGKICIDTGSASVNHAYALGVSSLVV
jgi:hypothetical protein